MKVFMGIDLPTKTQDLQEVRCLNCKRLLCKVDGEGTVEVKCPKCFETVTASAA